MGVLSELLLDERWAELQNALQLNADSSVLLFRTEGATDTKNYLQVIWGSTSD